MTGPLPAQTREPGSLAPVSAVVPNPISSQSSFDGIAAETGARVARDVGRVRSSIEQQRVLTDPWFGPDKVRHFFTSAAAQSLAYGALRSADVDHRESLLGASIVTALLGLGKELSDRRRGYGFSVKDLVWDAAGAAAMSVMLANTER